MNEDKKRQIKPNTRCFMKRFIILALTIMLAISMTVIPSGMVYADGEPNNGDHEHQYVAETISEADCHNRAVVRYTCSICGDIYTEEVGDTLEHNFQFGITTKQPTCDEEGTDKYVCTLCGDAEYRPSPALGHDLIYHYSSYPADGQPGNIDYWECSRCGKYFADSQGLNEVSFDEIIVPYAGTSSDPVAIGPGRSESIELSRMSEQTFEFTPDQTGVYDVKFYYESFTDGHGERPSDESVSECDNYPSVYFDEGYVYEKGVTYTFKVVNVFSVPVKFYSVVTLTKAADTFSENTDITVSKESSKLFEFTPSKDAVYLFSTNDSIEIFGYDMKGTDGNIYVGKNSIGGDSSIFYADMKKDNTYLIRMTSWSGNSGPFKVHAYALPELTLGEENSIKLRSDSLRLSAACVFTADTDDTYFINEVFTKFTDVGGAFIYPFDEEDGYDNIVTENMPVYKTRTSSGVTWDDVIGDYWFFNAKAGHKYIFVSDRYTNCTTTVFAGKKTAEQESKLHDLKWTKVFGGNTFGPFTYNGKAQKPNILDNPHYDKKTTFLAMNGHMLVLNKDITVTYKDNVNVGTAKIVLTGRGKYYGTKTYTYKINPKGTTLYAPVAAKRALTVKWKKQATKMSKSVITGYQIQLATNKAFTKNKKTVTVAGYSKVSRKVTGLKAKTTYYVRIRTYKTVSGKTYYSTWSAVKYKKTK